MTNHHRLLVIALLVGFAPEVTAANKVGFQLMDDYAPKTFFEAQNERTYFGTSPQKPLQIRVTGPVNIVILMRADKRRQIEFKLTLNDDSASKTARLLVAKSVSRGMYVRIPDGQHTLRLTGAHPVWLRIFVTNRMPNENQPIIEWSYESAIPPVPLVAIRQARTPSSETDPGNSNQTKPLPDPLQSADATATKAEDIQSLCRHLASCIQDKHITIAPIDERMGTPQGVGKQIQGALGSCLRQQHNFTIIDQQNNLATTEPDQTPSHPLLAGSVFAQGQNLLVTMRSIEAKTGGIGCMEQAEFPIDHLSSRKTTHDISNNKPPAEQTIASAPPQSQPAPKAESIDAAKTVPKAPTKQTPPAAPASEIGSQSKKSIEVQLRMLADKLAAGFSDLPGKGRYERWVVSTLHESGPTVRVRELGTLISAQLATFLKRDHGFLLLERERLSIALKEMELGMTGMVDANKAAQAGKLLGAQALVVGSVAESPDTFTVNVRLISTESAQVLVADSIQLPRFSLIALSEESVVLRTRSGAVFRSLVLPGWGQFYNRQPIKGSILLGAEIALISTAITLHLLGKADEDEYHATNFAQRYPDFSPSQLAQKASKLRRDAQDFYQARNLVLSAVIGVYLYTLLDSYLFGFDRQENWAMGISPMTLPDVMGKLPPGVSFTTRF